MSFCGKFVQLFEYEQPSTGNVIGKLSAYIILYLCIHITILFFIFKIYFYDLWNMSVTFSDEHLSHGTLTCWHDQSLRQEAIRLQTTM